MHRGVGILIRDKEGERFFVQEKDALYPIKKWRHCLSLWGGKIETGETELEGLKRELEEELGLATLENLLAYRKIKTTMVEAEKPFVFTFYEGIYIGVELDELLNYPINEGNGKIVHKSEILKLEWIWGLEPLIKEYCSGLRQG